jgi:hypothetical protein
MTDSIPLRMKETTTITKFAPGVDPRDPTSVPEEVIVQERYLTESELKQLFEAMEQERQNKQMRMKQE